jgi:MFS family permease
MLVYGIAVPVLPRFPAVAAGGDAAAGMLFAVYAAGLVVVTPLAGRWVDRRGPRAPMLAGLVVLAAATIAFALVEPMAALVLARTAQGAAAALSWVAGLALVAATSPLQVRARNLGLVLSAVSVGVLIGPPLGGLLADVGGRHLPFLVAAGIALVDGLLRLVLIGPDLTRATDDPARMRHVMRVRGAVSVGATVALGAGILAATEPVLPRQLDGMGHGPTTTGLVYGGAVLACAVLTPLAGMLTARVRTSLLVTGAAVFAIAGLVVLGIGAGVGGGLGPMVAGMVLIGIGGGGVLGSITPTMTVLGERSDPPAIGAAFAVFNLAYAAGLFIGPALSGPMVQVAGFGPAMGLLAGALAIAALSGSLGLRQRLGS